MVPSSCKLLFGCHCKHDDSPKIESGEFDDEFNGSCFIYGVFYKPVVFKSNQSMAEFKLIYEFKMQIQDEIKRYIAMHI
ncbi:hypothetical protein L6452_00879 [Arctium lappa]|uniref:Uncharacterized protein n=1 Tax=Arctium lappa TaxID=4217 RepID=A0ACB9FGE2_ARCLA|nr:hypothetical protein L6452_00879 [Arctium lappa]